MAHKYAQIVFTDIVRQVQSELNSRAGYASMDQGEDYNHLLSEYEAEFIRERDSFYMASVSETGWPYVQHRGGPKGFMKVLDESTLGFSDYSGNRQYVSTGNFRVNDRVALFFMDYPNSRRLKMMGRIQLVAEDDWDTQALLESENYRAEVERSFIIKIEAFDWNCPQHITPRFTETELEQLIAPVIEENKHLKQQTERRPNLPMELGSGNLPLVISGIRQLTPRIRAYELRHREGKKLPEIEAGAHLKIPVQLKDGSQVLRHYSVCSNPCRRDIYEIAVLREPSGNGGSIAIHEFFNLGLILNCEIPGNYFQLDDQGASIVLIAGGVGITPIKAMAQQLKQQGQPFELHYAGRSQMEMAFFDQLQREFPDDGYFYRSDQGEKLNIASLLAKADQGICFYACGPLSLLQELQQQAVERNIGLGQIRFEQFSDNRTEENTKLTVELAKSAKTLQVGADESVLDVLVENGVSIPYSCHSGACKTCAIKVLEGKPEHRDSCLSEIDKSEKALFCPCVSRSETDYLILDI
ncbi:MAG: 2Fe-2S iron-sulfur cluster-binding protein [Neptuniibacter sp.]